MFYTDDDGNEQYVGPANTTLESVIAQVNTTVQARRFYMSVNNGTSFIDGFSNGSPVVDGKTTAPIYMTVVEPAENGSFIFVFYVWYNYNGCSDLDVIIDEAGNVQKSLDFTSCSIGSHEGDWESIRVEVCGDLSKVVSVVYGAHKWDIGRVCCELLQFCYSLYLFWFIPCWSA